ncbi:hypothetical protein [Mesorhizobium sp. 128a]
MQFLTQDLHDLLLANGRQQQPFAAQGMKSTLFPCITVYAGRWRDLAVCS